MEIFETWKGLDSAYRKNLFLQENLERIFYKLNYRRPFSAIY